ncbi:O-antigen ligase family protein [Bacillus sp. HMF5848]|uniref:O-antigen ligase family protein n=1 Tax=Bacillus sp. HMF5848 TaxID=2495421 RepID=UPI000F793B77|nr:O-antigen ligase family protein [Bacillus sp. HMF5848]RSK28674.1 O-antigen ligase family protein [Bacillus sp. HMF5848]
MVNKIKNLMFIVVSIIFVASPYSKGLFFDTDFNRWAVVILVLSAISFLFINQLELKYLFIFTWPALFIISIPTALSLNSTIIEIIRWTTYATFLILLVEGKKNLNFRKLSPIIFYLTGSWIALLGFLTKWGMTTFKDSFVYAENRMASVLQYPNTFAALIAAFILFGLIYLTKLKMNRKEILFYSFPIILFINALLASGSRGVLVIFPIIWFIGLVSIANARKQIDYIAFSASAVLIGGIVFSTMQFTDIGVPYIKEILYVILGTLVYTSLTSGYKEYLNRVKLSIIEKYNRRISILIPTAIVVAGVLLVFDLFYKGLIFKLLPQNLQERIATINFSAASVQGRQAFYDTAFSILKESPLFGFGGGTWRYSFTKFQEVPFWSTNVHNFYLGKLIDLGLFGGTIFLGVFVFLLYLAIRQIWIQKQEEPTVKIAALMSILMILSHSAMDFNMSYGTTVLTVMWLFAIILEPNIQKSTNKSRKQVLITKTVGIATVLTVLIINIGYMTAENMLKNQSNRDSIVETESTYTKAMKYNPFNTDYIVELVEMYANAYTKTQDQEIKANIKTLVEKGRELEPQNAEMLFKFANAAEKINDKQLSVELLEDTIKNDKYRVSAYYALIGLYSEMALQAATNDDMESKNLYAEKAADYYSAYMDIYNTFGNVEIADKRNLNINEKAHYFAGQANFLLNDFQTAIEAFNRTGSAVQNSSELLVRQTAMLCLAYANTDPTKAKEIFAEGRELTDNFNNYVNGFQKLINDN